MHLAVVLPMYFVRADSEHLDLNHTGNESFISPRLSRHHRGREHLADVRGCSLPLLTGCHRVTAQLVSVRCVHTRVQREQEHKRQSRHTPSLSSSYKAPAAFPRAKLGAQKCRRLKAALQLVMHSCGAAMGFTGMTFTADIRSEYLHWISVSALEVWLGGDTVSAF